MLPPVQPLSVPFPVTHLLHSGWEEPKHNVPHTQCQGWWHLRQQWGCNTSFQLLDIHIPLSFYMVTQCPAKICLLLIFTYGYFLIFSQWQSKALAICWLSIGWVRWVHSLFQSNRHIPIKTPHYRIEVTDLGICTGLRPSHARLIKFSCRHLSVEDREAQMTDTMTILYQSHEATKDYSYLQHLPQTGSAWTKITSTYKYFFLHSYYRLCLLLGPLQTKYPRWGWDHNTL